MTDLMAGEIIAIAVLVLGVLYLVSRLIRGTEPDVGIQVFLLDDCDDDYGCPMVIDEAAEAEALPTGMEFCRAFIEANALGDKQATLDAWNAVYADYGSTVVHRLCLDKRTAGLPPCSDCAPRMGAAL